MRTGIKYATVFFTVLLLLTGALVLSAKIPQSAIRANVLESAEYLCKSQVFEEVTEGKKSSMIDRYADSILLGIAYQYDAAHPLESVMKSSYYHMPMANENENLLEAVSNGYEANQQYLRYWHGSNAVVRPLLVLFSIREIYVCGAVVLTGLILALFWLFWKHKAFAPAAGMAAGLVLTSVWYVPFSLEYTWMHLLMLILSLVALSLAYRSRWNWLGIFFLISGMLTSYLDFLTTETLSFLVPLLLLLWTDRRQNGAQALRTLFSKAGKAAAVWGCGYAGMWIMKWLLAALCLHENVLPYVLEHVGERLGGDIGISWWSYLTGAVGRNISCLFPLEYGVTGKMIALALLLGFAYLGYVYRKKQICQPMITIYVLAGLIPYIRYLVLHNHSYLHFFFTYRAQMATILAAVLILEELTEWRLRVHADAGRRTA